jgi:hypothetical protein
VTTDGEDNRIVVVCFCNTLSCETGNPDQGWVSYDYLRPTDFHFRQTLIGREEVVWNRALMYNVRPSF